MGPGALGVIGTLAIMIPWIGAQWEEYHSGLMLYGNGVVGITEVTDLTSAGTEPQFDSQTRACAQNVECPFPQSNPRTRIKQCRPSMSTASCCHTLVYVGIPQRSKLLHRYLACNQRLLGAFPAFLPPMLLSGRAVLLLPSS